MDGKTATRARVRAGNQVPAKPAKVDTATAKQPIAKQPTAIAKNGKPANSVQEQIVGYRFWDEDEGICSLFVYPSAKALEEAIQHYRASRNHKVIRETIIWNGTAYYTRLEDEKKTVAFYEKGKLPAEYHK